jgi:hypothetical protein
MKKTLLTMLAMFAFVFANAQEMRFGVKGGLFASSYKKGKLHKNSNDYNYYLNTDAYESSNIGLYVGGLLELPLVDDFKIQPEFLLSFVPSNDGYIAISIPVMVKYPFFEKFYAEAGPAINYAVDGDSAKLSPSFNLGATYDVLQDFYVELRADVGLGGYLQTNLNAGVGYRF